MTVLPVPAIAAPATVQQFLLFRQKDSYFAIELTKVCEVLFLKDQSLASVPNTASFILGLTNLRGEILVVADFGRLSNIGLVELQRAQGRILVLEIPDPQNMQLLPLHVGVAVSQVEGVVSLHPDQIVSAMDVSPELAPVLKGLYDYEGRFLMILDAEAIAQSQHW
ncbi:chemotaxis protein CheW [Trichocoleus sp. FACHB-262]|uniref:chemotaxis protein CheW n=1 Tax=Trichocoleus sp. FACHB-262 TaxID=2692869 RepID=UPI001684329D|nr:chemotaxis protein CheW [Trichocoleus sp. FACHB-262]MBD2122803.1 chemotaxis protein CheW [Trichocoleus sp. FACHB-262]